jgi:hypothetical protein
MWWGGAGQDGWGVAIQQRGDLMFAAWYTYDADGQPTWFYMPAGRETSARTYAGPLYRTTGAAWVGAHYAGGGTRAIEAGSLELAFGDDGHATMTSTVDGHTQSRPILRFPF